MRWLDLKLGLLNDLILDCKRGHLACGSVASGSVVVAYVAVVSVVAVASFASSADDPGSSHRPDCSRYVVVVVVVGGAAAAAVADLW